MIRPLLLAATAATLTTAACSESPSTERPDAKPLACSEPTVITRYRVDATTLPVNSETARATAFDVVNSDGQIDNQLGMAFGTVVSAFTPDFRPDAAAAATFAGPVDWEIVTETCPDTDETRVRVGSVGGSTPRAGGSLGGDQLAATHGCAEVPLGAITGGPEAGWILADQLALDVDFAVGHHELTGTLGFALDQPDAAVAIANAMAPFLTTEETQPALRMTILDLFDKDHDGVVTPAEVQAADIYRALTAPDSGFGPRPEGGPQCPPGNDQWLSFGLAVHAVEE